MKILISILSLIILTGCYEAHMVTSGGVLTDQQIKGNPLHYSLHETLVENGIIEKVKNWKIFYF